MRERVAQLAAFMDGPGRLGRDMAGDAAREGELLEQGLHALLVRGDVGVDLGVGALEVDAGDQPGAAVAGPGDIDRAPVVLHDDAVEVGIDEVQAGRGAPVAEKARLDVLGLQRLVEQRVVEQVDLADRQIIGRAPPGVDPPQFFLAERVLLHRPPEFPPSTAR